MNKKLNSKQLARTWPYPRYKPFIKGLRKSASEWFQQQNLQTSPRMVYCLASHNDWKNNIILPAVSAYIENMKIEAEEKGLSFPLHQYLHHGLSSQAMVFNLIGPLIIRNDLSPLLNALKEKGVTFAYPLSSAEFEYEDRDVFNEDSGQPTSIDVIVRDISGTPRVFIESKFVEQEFGGCSVFKDGDCDGKNPFLNGDSCYLHHIGRKYLDLMKKYGFDKTMQSEKQCPLACHYQFFREVLFSLCHDGIFILLSDERSPVFEYTGDGQTRGLIPFLRSFVPQQYQSSIISLSIQSLVKSIINSGNHEWIFDFNNKYGIDD